MSEGEGEGKSNGESVSKGESEGKSKGEKGSTSSISISTCALDLNASTAESLERMRSTSVSSAPICRPQPIPMEKFSNTA